jgi:beta-glucanase (GH16 family)
VPSKRSAAVATAYHVYSVTRAPQRITFGIDGRTTATVTPADLKPGQTWVFDRPMFVILNLAVGGNWPGPPNDSTPDVAKMEVDWLRYAA